jgi:hypothetical protein
MSPRCVFFFLFLFFLYLLLTLTGLHYDNHPRRTPSPHRLPRHDPTTPPHLPHRLPRHHPTTHNTHRLRVKEDYPRPPHHPTNHDSRARDIATLQVSSPGFGHHLTINLNVPQHWQGSSRDTTRALVFFLNNSRSRDASDTSRALGKFFFCFFTFFKTLLMSFLVAMCMEQ